MQCFRLSKPLGQSRPLNLVVALPTWLLSDRYTGTLCPYREMDLLGPHPILATFQSWSVGHFRYGAMQVICPRLCGLPGSFRNRCQRLVRLAAWNGASW